MNVISKELLIRAGLTVGMVAVEALITLVFLKIITKVYEKGYVVAAMLLLGLDLALITAVFILFVLGLKIFV